MIQRALCPVLISRDAELSLVEDALLAAHRGEGRVVVISGDAGIGKTRLATELRRRAEKLGCVVMWGGCSEADLALPYLPFLEAIGNHLSSTDIERLRGELGSAQRELGQLFPQLVPEAAPAAAGDPTQAKLRLFEAILELLRIPAREHGLLLVIEDLHWADASTRELLDYMTRRVRNTRVLVLATYRRDEMHRKHPLLPTVQSWRRSGLAEVVELDDLPPDGVAAMVGAIFDEESISDEFRDVMHQRSEGNPFVLEEMLKEALDRGDIYRTDTGWDRKSLDELRIPETVRDTILLRLERLEDDQVAVLRCAAVLGASFDYSTLASVSGSEASRMEELLDACVRQQLIEADGRERGRFRFRHALTREAIYEDMTGPMRERLHLRAAEVLAANGSTSPAERAMHLVAAGHVTEAVPLFLEAAARAAHGLAYEEAAGLYRRALPHLVDPLQRARVHCALGETLWRGNDARSAEEYLLQGITVLEGLGDLREAATHRLLLGRCRWELARMHEARADYERARDVLENFGPSEELATAYLRLSGLLGFDGRGQEAIEMGERAVETATACGADAPRIWAYTFIGLGYANTGDTDRALEFTDRSRREAEELGLTWIAGNALHDSIVLRAGDLRFNECVDLVPRLRNHPDEAWRNLGLFDDAALAYALGDLPRSVALWHEFLADQSQDISRLWASRELCHALTDLDDIESARKYLIRPDPARELQDFISEVQVSVHFHLAAGDLERAVAEARLGVTTVVEPKGEYMSWMADPVVQALISASLTDEASSWLARFPEPTRQRDPFLQRAQARIALATDAATDALDHARRALDRFVDVGFRIEEARTRLVIADALERLGDKAAAVAELRRALDDARTCGGGLIVRLATEELLRLGAVVDGAVSQRPAAGTVTSAAPTSNAVETVGERMVTVMFADIRGYTQMTAANAPADMADRIATFQRWAVSEIERHHGFVDKFAGDAVMATFNVSGASVDHCLHALQAAMALRDKAALMDLGVGVGIAVGPAIVGRMTPGANVSVLGETTNLASRLQSSAHSGEIVLDASAMRRVRQWLEERGLEVVSRQSELKGFESPVQAFVVAAATAPADH